MSKERLQTTIVPPIGPLDAKICIIGEAPGEDEDWTGEPFVGAAGQFQNRALKQSGILRSEVLLTNVFLQRPPNNDVGYYFQDKSMTKYTWEAQEHLDHLEKWLRELSLHPNLLVAAGRTAMYALTGKKRIWKWRGSILPCTLVEGYLVYPTFHPSGVMRMINEPLESMHGERKIQATNMFPLYLSDLERIKEQSERKEIPRPERKIEIELSFEEAVTHLEYINKENITCSVDIETYPGAPSGPILWMIGFSPRPDWAFVIYFLRNQRFAWPLQQEAHLLQLISEYFLNPKAQKIFQGGGYDLSILGRYYGLRLADGTYEDTMWCHHAKFPYMKKDLATLTSLHTWETYYKDEGKVNYGKRSGDHAEGIYNGKDCCVTREVFSILRRQAKEMDVWSGYRRSMSYMPSLLAMMINGVKADRETKDTLQEDFSTQVNFHTEKVHEIAGEPINLNSPKQLCGLLYYKYALKEQRKRTRGRPLTTDADAMQKLKRLYPNLPILEHIIQAKKFSKLHRTYTNMRLNDDRIRTSYGFVSTWRLSSKKSPFDDGGNLQNIPTRTKEGKLVRQLFVTDDMEPYPEEEWDRITSKVSHITQGVLGPHSMINGKQLMVARDLSQAEARYVVWDAQDLRVMEMFLDGSIDVHWERTKDIFNLNRTIQYEPKEKIEVPMVNLSLPMYDLRRLGKTAKHAGNYGMKTHKFLQILAKEGFILEYRQAKAILQQTVENDPYLTSWHASIQEKLKSQRMLVTPPPFSRKRYFLHSRLNDNLFRAGYAFCPQSTIGEILQHAIQGIFDNCSYLTILLNIHDEIIYEVPPHLLAKSLYETQKELEIPFELHGRELRIPCEAKIGYDWGNLYEFKPQLKDRI